MNKLENIHRSDLLSSAQALCDDAQFRASIQRHLALVGTGHNLQLAIHPNDQMLSHSLLHLRSAGAALSQYFGVALQQQRAAEQVIDVFFPDRSQIRVLDFACGFGRLLRFLVHSVSPTQIWASDIQHEAVDFVSAQFGVNGIYSTAEPRAFQPDQKFDVIWVASLFSHLPANLFQEWLRTLTGLLTPRGVLCFSVHDECLLPPGRAMPAQGILFAGHSENEELERAAYGTTHVSETYVERTVQQVLGAGHPHYRVRRGLAYQQDLYVVAKDEGRDLSGLDSFRWGPWGWVDRRKLAAAGDLSVSGWAASIDEGGIDSVSIVYDGALTEHKTDVDRSDVEDAYDDPRLRQVGWEAVCNARPAGTGSFLEVSALGANGERALLYAGPAIDPKLAWKWLGLEFVAHGLGHILYRLRGRFG